ncbi:MAG TPA: cupin domain-containing protein, partial [Candidatus Angelobacter sp.]|nr:cupin domain-containing protein [Candidatus Angelobacter sp.]
MFGKLLRFKDQEVAPGAASDPGPNNPVLDRHNPSAMVPPATDAGAVPQFKYPFSMAHKRLYDGGWSHEVTIRELPIAHDLAGVLMRLTAGGIRELHWHAAAEWAIMLYGNARITAIDWDGKSFVADSNVGDMWFFPTGIPHSIQGLKPDGAKFLLVFDEGHFSEHETVLLTDLMAHMPREVLTKNFGVSPKALKDLPKEEKFIFQADLPRSLAADQRAAAGSLGISPHDFAFRADQPAVIRRSKGGEVRIVDSSSFKVATTVAAAI